MTEASWSGNDAGAIEWTMSASLEDVPRGGEQVPEVTSLRNAVRAWGELSPEQQAEAVLTSERPVAVPGNVAGNRFVGDAIATLAAYLPEGDADAQR